MNSTIKPQAKLAVSLATFGALAISLFVSPSALSAAEQPAPTPETAAARDARLAWWREARFGLFIHWGLYARAGGHWNGKSVPGFAEWIMNDAKIPVADYQRLAGGFNPVKFDADKWVGVAKAAGMKYIVITAKHHDGFAMFRTATDGFNIFDATGFKRDPLMELAVAARKQGLKLGFYYSQAQDWHQPGGGNCRGAWDPAQGGSMDDYLKNIAVPQVKELLTRYGKVSVLWWDTPCGMTPERAAPLAALLKLQPGIVTNDRLGGGFRGDTGTPEGEIPPFPETDREWETCMTINGTWGYRADALPSVRSSQSLLLDLVNTASKGGNYLLNVGPDAEGEIPAVEVLRLKEMGAWLRVNGESIYGTAAAPFRIKPAWGRYTARPGKLYLHVLEPPSGGTITVPIRNRARRVSLLAAPGTNMQPTYTAAGLVLRLPKSVPGAVDTVIVVHLAGPLDPLPEDVTVRPSPDGALRLGAETVQLVLGDSSEEAHAQRTTFAGDETHPFLDWKGKRGDGDTLRWQVRPERAGDYEVSLTYAAWPFQAGSSLSLSAGGRSLEGVTSQSKNGYVPEDFKFGTMHLDAGTPVTVTLKGVPAKTHGMASRFVGVVFTPLPATAPVGAASAG